MKIFHTILLVVISLRGASTFPITFSTNLVDEATSSVVNDSETTEAAGNELFSSPLINDLGAGAALSKNWTWYIFPPKQKNRVYRPGYDERMRLEMKSQE